MRVYLVSWMELEESIWTHEFTVFVYVENIHTYIHTHTPRLWRPRRLTRTAFHSVDLPIRTEGPKGPGPVISKDSGIWAAGPLLPDLTIILGTLTTVQTPKLQQLHCRISEELLPLPLQVLISFSKHVLYQIPDPSTTVLNLQALSSCKRSDRTYFRICRPVSITASELCFQSKAATTSS